MSHAKNGSQYAIHQAIRKYDGESFEWSIIDTADNQEELDEKELYWIDYYNTYGLGGYNMSVGGQLSKKTDDNADDLSAMFGGKEFLVYDLEGNFIKGAYSQTAFAKEIGVNVTTVNNILRGLKNSTKGFTLIFKDEFSEEKLNKLIKRINDWHKKFVVFDKDENYIGKWDNKIQCGKALDFSRRTIQCQLNENKSRSTRIKYQCYFIDDIPQHLKDKIKDVI